MKLLQKNRPIQKIIAALMTISVGLAACSDTPEHDGYDTVEQAVTLCGTFDTLNVNGKEYVIQNNIWNSTGGQQCIDAPGGASTAFSVAQNTNSSGNTVPTAYPGIFRGCHWGNCTTSSGMPVQVSAMPEVRSSWSVNVPPSGKYNVAYDIWFHTSSSTSGQPNDLELMIWLNHNGGAQPAGTTSGNPQVSIGGVTWEVFHTTEFGWDYAAFRPVGGQKLTSVSDLDIRAFTDYCRTRGWVSPSSYMIAIEAGFELWNGGAGLATNSFCAKVGGSCSGGSGGTGGTGGTGGSGGSSGSGGSAGNCSATAVGTGSGLRGEYFNNTALTAPVAGSRTESVNFNFGSGSPGVGGLGSDNFSVRWSGQVEPRYSGSYTFCTTSDDGVRLWVNAAQLVNNWTDHAPTENCGTINLTAGTRYDVRLEYYERTGGAVAQLRWSHGCLAKEIIPSTQLYSPSGCTSNAGCNDNNACTTDSCNISSGVCSNTPITCNDNNACTTDSCNTSSGCVFSPNGSCGSGGAGGSGGTGGSAGAGGSSGSTPCSSLCANPVVFAGPSYQSGNIGTGATCHETLATLNGGNCSNIASPRSLTVNGVAMSCGGWALPAKRNGGYCIQVNAGTPAWSSFATW